MGNNNDNIQAPDIESIFRLFDRWGREHPGLLSVREYGKSVQGRPLLALELTNQDVGLEAKEVVLMTALHSGIEQSATVSLLYLIKWLLSPDPAAREILAGQIIIFMPLPNPDGYVSLSFYNAHGEDLYRSWTLDGPENPGKHPEAVAVQRVMDEYQPEIHADWHGMVYSHPDSYMLENSGCSFSNYSVRPYHRFMAYMMDEAALQEGYPSDLLEEDAEELFWGPDMESVSHKFWRGRPTVMAAHYCYNKFHTMSFVSEIGWERSGFLRHKKLLETGVMKWPGEYWQGYPTRVISKHVCDSLVCYGTTAAARRRSRVEMWNLRHQLAHASNYPSMAGSALHITALTPDAADYWLAENSLKKLVEKIDAGTGLEKNYLKDFIARLPDGNAQGPGLSVKPGRAIGPVAAIQNGISMRLRFSFENAAINEVRLNGYPLAESPVDGYVAYSGKGYTYLQVNLSPEKVKERDLFIITCRYRPVDNRESLIGEIFG
jgi:hypothetical protein